MSLPKYISGISAFVEDGLYIVITYATDFGYDKISNVEDVSDSFSEDIIISQNENSFTIGYGTTRTDETSKKLRITFESGYTKTLEVFTPTYKRRISLPALQLQNSVFGQSDFGNFEQTVFAGPETSLNLSAYAMMPMLDPYEKFGHKSSWTYSQAGVAVSFKGNIISNIDESVPFLGVPKMAPAEQFGQFVSILGKGNDFTSASDVWSNALDNTSDSQVLFAFVWSKDIPELPSSNVKIFEVCSDPRSPSYYRTTSQDSAGNTIPASYLNGTNPAIFRPGSCAVDPSPFKIYISTTDVVDGSDGKISIAIAGNAASPAMDPWTNRSAYSQDKHPTYPDISTLTFQYKITDPKTGVVTDTGAIVGNTHEFTGLTSYDRPYTIQAIDVATGVTVTTATTITDSKTRNCWCDIGTAVNYQPTAGPPTGQDLCGECIECPANQQVTVGGILQPNQFVVESQATITNASDPTTSDGSLALSYSIAPEIYSEALPFMGSNLYDIHINETTGPNGNPGASVGSSLNNSGSAIFTGLAPGWYLVGVVPTVFTACASGFYYEVSATEEEVDCHFTQSFTIDPCTGLLSDVSIESNYSYSEVLYFVDGLSVTLPVTVNVGQTITTVIVYNDPNVNCEKGTQQYVVQDADRNCTELDPTPGVGCTDPTALNYDPSATVDSGMCQYGISGCMDPNATNYNPEATVQGTEPNTCIYLCTFSPISAITVNGNIPTMTFFAGQDPVVYSVTWYSFSDGSTTVVENSGIGPSLADGAYMVTLETSLGCVFSEIFGINTNIVVGCMDINAENYQPSANVPYNENAEYPYPHTIVSQECEYNLEQSGCVPSTLLNTIDGLTRCIARKSELYVNAMKAGRLSDCLINDLRILTLIRYIFRQRGLECVFNCKDGQTPDTVAVSCASKWEAGGPTGSSLMYSDTQSYTWGDVVKMPVSGNIYICTAINGLIPGISPEDPFTTQFWDVCRDVVDPTGSINRIDPYLEKAKNICTDCGINIDIPEITESSEVTEEGSTMGGTALTISGAPVNLN